jgi:hypothetical protein
MSSVHFLALSDKDSKVHGVNSEYNDLLDHKYFGGTSI